MALVEDIQGMARELNLDEYLIRQLLEMLGAGAADVREGRVRTNAAGGFGGSAAGSEVSWDAGSAHDIVAEAMTAWVEELRGFQGNLSMFRDDVHRTDESAQAALVAIEQRSRDLAAPRIRDTGPANETGGADA
jgi:hypothetical protein